MQNYCTLFDKNYLISGLALYSSICDFTDEFRLYVLAMDDEAERILLDLSLDKIIVIPISKITAIKKYGLEDRMTFGQICWTCQPFLIEYILEYFMLDDVIYLEADLFFFSNPNTLAGELNFFSVSLVPHKINGDFSKAKKSGIYCVQFNLFKNDETGLTILEDWKKNSLLYSKKKKDSYPGQTCMNHWPEFSSSVRVVDNVGAGVAPWNVGDYLIQELQDKIYVNDKELIFYHFHELAFLDRNKIFISTQQLSSRNIKIIYMPYIKRLNKILSLMEGRYKNYSYYRLHKFPNLYLFLQISSFSELKKYVKYIFLKFSGTLSKNCINL